MEEEYSIKEDNNIVKIYRWINKLNWEVSIIIVLVICVVFDFVPCNYWHPFEIVFRTKEDDCIGIASMTLVVWTFTMALVVFWMGRMEDKHCGIRIMDSYMRNIYKGRPGKGIYGNENDSNIYIKVAIRRLVKIGIAIAFEVAVVFGAAIYKWEITLKVTVVLQLLTMIYVFMAVCIESSEAVILKQIVESSVDYIIHRLKIGNEIDSFLAKMIENVEYKNEGELNQLKQVIMQIAAQTEEWIGEKKFYGKGEWRRKKKQKMRLKLQWYMKACMDHIIHICKSKDVSEIIVKNLMSELQSIYAKRGIFLSVIDHEYHDETPSVKEILNINFKDRDVMIAAGIAYSRYAAISEKHYQYLTNDLRDYMSISAKENIEVIEVMKDMWLELVKENKGQKDEIQKWNVDALWEIVFPEGGKGK